MGARLLRHATYDRKPWNNGGGITRDVWLWPETAAQDAFDIRLSLASIDTDGPFSAFPGIDRTITQVAGSPFVLVFSGAREHRMEVLQPFSFDSVQTPSSRLGKAGVSAFNVMTRQGRWTHKVSIVQGGEPVNNALPHNAIAILHAVLGDWQVDAGDRLVAGVGDTVVVEQAQFMHLTAPSGAAAVVAILQPAEDTS